MFIKKFFFTFLTFCIYFLCGYAVCTSIEHLSVYANACVNIQNTNFCQSSKNQSININLLYNKSSYVLNFNQDPTKPFTIIDSSHKSTHNLNYQNVLFQIKKLKKWKFDNCVIFDYIFSPIKNQLNKIISSINYDPINADINFNKECNCFNIVNDIDGLVVNETNLKNEIINSLLISNNITINIKTTNTKATIKKQDVFKNCKKQSTFSTFYGNSNNDRKNNISLACNTLNGYKILPDQVFSFNEAIGKRCEANGYKEANIIVDGQFVKGVGGGVCQVSSTLYNALLLANIKPIEVHKHSLPVSYVKPGLDAMVSWNTADLKFKNTTDYPIFITSNCNGSNLTFNIYGNTKQDSFYLKTESKIIKTIPHRGDKIEPDTRGKYLDRIMYKGEYARERAPRDGYIAHVYLNTYQNGVLIKQDLIREVMYEPQLGLVYEGTKDPPENNKI